MKKLTYLLFLSIGLMGCSADAVNEELIVADAKFKVQNVESFNVPVEICVGVPAQFSITAALKTNLQVQQWDGEEWVQVYQTSQSTTSPQIFDLSFSEAGTYDLRYKIGGGGFTQTRVTVVNCSTSCDRFSYVANENGTYTFTYVPGEDITGAKVVFTFAQGTNVTGYNWDWNGNSSTRSEIMNLSACRIYTWTISISPDCSGNSKNSNVWTDFTVNGVSKKNTSTSTPNIIKSCS